MVKNILYKIVRKIKGFLYRYYKRRVTDYVKKMDYVLGVNKKERDFPEIIISLTTFPKRLPNIDLCIKSILNQSFKPDRIIIWLGSDTSEEIADKYLGKYREYGVEYYVDKSNNYFSHKKYIYAFKQFKDSIIITLDDDLIYEKNTLKSLVEMYKKYPNCIIARRVHYITFKNNNLCKYRRWNWEYFLLKSPSHRLFATTGAGTLFPPSIYPSLEVCNFDDISKYALTADDVWLNMMAVKYNIKVKWAENFFQMPPEVLRVKGENLGSVNVVQCANDNYIKKIMNDFEISNDSLSK